MVYSHLCFTKFHVLLESLFPSKNFFSQIPILANNFYFIFSTATRESSSRSIFRLTKLSISSKYQKMLLGLLVIAIQGAIRILINVVLTMTSVVVSALVLL